MSDRDKSNLFISDTRSSDGLNYGAAKCCRLFDNYCDFYFHMSIFFFQFKKLFSGKWSIVCANLMKIRDPEFSRTQRDRHAICHAINLGYQRYHGSLLVSSSPGREITGRLPRNFHQNDEEITGASPAVLRVRNNAAISKFMSQS